MATRIPRQKRARKTYDAILEAASEVIAEHGLGGATTQRIADRAGVGIGSFYEYFEDKDAVARALFERMTADIVEIVRASTPELVRLDVTASTRLLLHRVGDMVRARGKAYVRAAHYALGAELAVDRAPIVQVLSELAMQYLMQHPELLVMRGVPGGLYFFIHGGIHAFVHFLADPHPPVSYDAFIDSIAKMIGHLVHRELEVVADDGAPGHGP